MKKIALIIAVVLLALAGAERARAQGTAFTYQGRLLENGIAVTDVRDFEFRLFSASSGGVAVGPVLARDNLGVTNGLFTAVLNFSVVFDGLPLFLEIAVRPGTTGSYTTLSPRQQLTAAPYAVRAEVANSVR